MSEQYPLLYDDLSEEEKFSPQYHRRLMSRARARNHVKGAAAIITRWPEHWTTLLNYWWIGVGMIALSTFIIYNCLFSYAELQPANNFYSKPSNVITSKPTPKPSIPLKVFMHVFVDDKQEIDLNDYLPYIKIIANKYTNFNYDLIIIANDTHVETKNHSDKENNDMALNKLWANDNSYKKMFSGNDNLRVQYVTLSKYFNDSPLKKYWKNLPHQFLKFLVRAVCIWEKGGIAFNPIILTPQSPHSIYIEKIYNILKKYNTRKINKKPASKNFQQYITSKRTNKLNNKPNNIRDIINALESVETTVPEKDPLVEAETSNNDTVSIKRIFRSFTGTIDDKVNKTKSVEIPVGQDTYFTDEVISHKDISYKETSYDSSKLNLLPLFLDYIYHNNQTKSPDETTNPTINIQPKIISKSNDINNNSSKMRHFWNGILYENKYEPVIINAKGMLDEYNTTKVTEKNIASVNSSFEVVIDLKGNIIATDTACHAFIGNMFTNAIHHDRSESVTDFIIKELSNFCNGLLASCVGIDVILL